MSLSLTGNQLCLSEDIDLSGLSEVVAAHLQSLNLPSCTGAQPPVPPQNPAAPEERAALFALYQATNGANWAHSDNWLSDAPVASWYGVVTDDGGRVTELNLPANGLSGPIPDLSALTSLTRLSLQTNQLRGPVPDLSALTSLIWLDLGHNQLRGPVPDLSALTSLSRLFLGVNGLSGPVPDLSALTNLTRLDLESNQLSGPIPDLSALSNLTRLDLESNQLSGPVPDLDALSNLTELDLGGNQLSGPVPDMNALVNLISLSLTGNQLCLSEDIDLSGLSEIVAAHLQSLNLPSCTGAQPPETPQNPAAPEERAALVALYQATNGANWTHNDNWLSDAPVAAWYGVVTDDGGGVTELNLPANGLIGPIPDLSALTSLTYLDLGYNRLSGSIPDMSALVGLSWLSLDHNQLTGPVPELGALTSLSRLFLGANGLTGPVPDMSALTSLTYLDLGYNQLTGPVPDLGALTSLSWLDLRGNLLCLPEEAVLSGPNEVVAAHLKSLNLPTCTDAELATVQGVRQT